MEVREWMGQSEGHQERGARVVVRAKLRGRGVKQGHRSKVRGPRFTLETRKRKMDSRDELAVDAVLKEAKVVAVNGAHLVDRNGDDDHDADEDAHQEEADEKRRRRDSAAAGRQERGKGVSCSDGCQPRGAAVIAVGVGSRAVVVCFEGV